MAVQGMSEKTRDFVFPGGEGLMGAGPVAPGPGEYSREWARKAIAGRLGQDAEEAGEAMGELAEALKPQIEREAQDRAARTQREEAKGQEASFRVLIQELCEAWGGSGDTDGEQEGRSGLEVTLCRLEKSNGQETSSLVQKWTYSPEELKTTTPDLETMAMDYAAETGRFGPYAFKIKAWQRGELVKATTLRIRVDQPAGYRPPAVEAPKPEPVTMPDPIQNLRETLGLAAMFKDALGLGGQAKGADAATLEAIRSSAAFQARYEAGEQHRRELRDVEDRHRQELESAKKSEYERGKQDGERDTRHEMERRIWDLENTGTESGGIVSEIVAAVGGPETLGGLMKAGAAWMNSQARKPAAPARPMIRPMVTARPNPVAPNIHPLRTGQGEPTRAEWLETIQTLEDAIEETRAQPDSQETRAIFAQLGNLHTQGMAEGPLAEWWAAIQTPAIPSEAGNLSWLELARRIAQVGQPEDQPEAGEEDMPTIEDLKATLLDHLNAGTPTTDILAELAASIPADTLSEWRGMLRFVPTGGAMAFLGIPDHLKERGAEVLEAFKNA